MTVFGSNYRFASPGLKSFLDRLQYGNPFNLIVGQLNVGNAVEEHAQQHHCEPDGDLKGSKGTVKAVDLDVYAVLDDNGHVMKVGQHYQPGRAKER